LLHLTSKVEPYSSLFYESMDIANFSYSIFHLHWLHSPRLSHSCCLHCNLNRICVINHQHIFQGIAIKRWRLHSIPYFKGEWKSYSIALRIGSAIASSTQVFPRDAMLLIRIDIWISARSRMLSVLLPFLHSCYRELRIKNTTSQR